MEISRIQCEFAAQLSRGGSRLGSETFLKAGSQIIPDPQPCVTEANNFCCLLRIRLWARYVSQVELSKENKKTKVENLYLWHNSGSLAEIRHLMRLLLLLL